MTREERKKLLIVEGLMHRLEIVHAMHHLRSDAQGNAVLSKLPGVLALIASSKAMPLIATVAPLVFGKSALSRLVRRALLTMGAGAGVAALIRRWRARGSGE